MIPIKMLNYLGTLTPPLTVCPIYNRFSVHTVSFEDMMEQPQVEGMTLHLAGIGVTHSIAAAMHNQIAKSLGLPWTFYLTECPTVEDVVDLAKKSTTAGIVVTMPYKNSIMKYLELDDWRR